MIVPTAVIGLSFQLVSTAPSHRTPSPDSLPASARARISAVAAAARPRIDGVLDDELWRRVAPTSGFVQAEPDEGKPATEATEVRVAYDDANLYIAAYMHDADPRGIVVNDLRKDFDEQNQDDFEVLLDTFGDRRNGYIFITNPAGAKADRQIANEGREMNASWDAIWTVVTRRVSDGWTAEIAIPFRSLRFNGGSDQRWGINFSRRIRRKNEIDFWSPVPRAYNLMRASLAGDLTGLNTGSVGRDLRVKPYVAGSTVRELGGPKFRRTEDVGVDLKYGVTPGLTLDVTVNPDFAQVEADEQQVNLTQFSQFFPEKREFFLENSGTFYVGDAARNNRVSNAPTPDEDLLLFFSRRIGLTGAGRAVSIPAGVRVSGSAAGFGIGALSMQTRTHDSTSGANFSVLRMRRNVGRGSDMGLLFMNHAPNDSTNDYNRLVGADATIRFAGRVDWNSYAVRSFAPNDRDAPYAARTSVNYEGNFVHVKPAVLEIGRGFRDDLGYYRRTDVRKWMIDMGIRPRLASLRAFGVREMHPHVTWAYYERPGDRDMIAKNLHTGYTLFLTNGGFLELSANPRFERIDTPFAVDKSVPAIAAGGYSWNEWQFKGSTDASRAVSSEFTLVSGGFWTGTQRTARATATLHPTSKLRITGGINRTAATLGGPGDPRFVASLYTARTSYSFTTSAFVDALTQFDPRTKQLSANVRLNVIHHPLSDLFIVYNDQRFVTADSPRAGRSLTIKATQMVAF
ncbi:MAG TPA: DUF5916 domain-containing protein [Gemmatimonadaceae bacterium]|nr:DUF5916 domain-containing protein [Gemmatimonadaceae bacterium]